MGEKPTFIILQFSYDEALEIQQSLADVACWMSGYEAGKGESIIGHGTVQTLNIRFRNQIRKVEKERMQ